MDLSIKLENGTRLYVRVAGLVKTKNGYLFEKSKKGYIYPIGGKIMVGESSAEALVREVREEVGMEVKGSIFRGLLEKFWSDGEEKIHEYSFVYEVEEEFTGTVPENFIEVHKDELQNHDIRPEQIPGIIKADKNVFQHIVVR